MAEQPDTQRQELELIQRAITAILGGAGTTQARRAAGSARKARRYSPVEKSAILGDAASGKTSQELFAKHGVCRETVARWLRRRRPEPARTHANNAGATPSEEARQNPGTTPADRHEGYHPHWREVLKLWRSRPGLGPAQIRNQLHRAKIKITVATVRKILEENGYTPPKPSIKEVEINRYEAARPLELVHMDFKHFYINRSKVFLLLLQDDFSRFLCGYRMTDSENIQAVIETFEQCVARYGKMQSVMTDAGSAFYSWNGINRFQKLLSEEYGVDQIKAKSPRSNGKIENVNKQIEKEVLDVDRYASLEEADAAIAEWIRFFNFERTHMGLPDGMVPADRFLFGWNQGVKGQMASSSEIQMAAWTEVLKVILTQIKRAA